MTPELQQKLDRIKAACREAIALGEKASPSPWVSGAEALYASVAGPSIPCRGVSESAGWDAAFIAHARSFSPAAARALLECIEKLERIATPALGGKMQQYDAQVALRSIAAHWPE